MFWTRNPNPQPGDFLVRSNTGILVTPHEDGRGNVTLLEISRRDSVPSMDEVRQAVAKFMVTGMRVSLTWPRGEPGNSFANKVLARVEGQQEIYMAPRDEVPMPASPLPQSAWSEGAKPPNGLAEVYRMYGDPKLWDSGKGDGTYRADAGWERANLVVLHDVNGTGLNVQVHRIVAPLFFEGLKRAMAAAPGYRIVSLGGYSPRHQRNNPKFPPSLHAFGAAVDINSDTNPMKSPLTTDMSAGFIAAFEDMGWRWGGRFKNPDPMHFQWATRV